MDNHSSFLNSACACEWVRWCTDAWCFIIYYWENTPMFSPWCFHICTCNVWSNKANQFLCWTYITHVCFTCSISVGLVWQSLVSIITAHHYVHKNNNSIVSKWGHHQQQSNWLPHTHTRARTHTHARAHSHTRLWFKWIHIQTYTNEWHQADRYLPTHRTSSLAPRPQSHTLAFLQSTSPGYA